MYSERQTPICNITVSLRLYAYGRLDADARNDTGGRIPGPVGVYGFVFLPKGLS